MPPPRSRKPAETVIHRPRYWACAIAPWISLFCVCCVCTPPHSPFRVLCRRLQTSMFAMLTSFHTWEKNPQGATIFGILRLWRFFLVDSPSWIYELLRPFISRQYHSLSDQWGPKFSVSLIHSFTVMGVLWWWIFLGLAVFLAVILVIWSFWRPFKQRFRGAMLFLNAVLNTGIGARWAELCKLVMASYLWTRSLGSTTVLWKSQKPKQHSQRAIKSQSQGSSAHSFSLKHFLLWALIGWVLLIFIFFILMYTSTKFNAWCWACLNGKCSTKWFFLPRTSVFLATNEAMDS